MQNFEYPGSVALLCHAERSRSIWLRAKNLLHSRPDLSAAARYDRPFGRDDHASDIRNQKSVKIGVKPRLI